MTPEELKPEELETKDSPVDLPDSPAPTQESLHLHAKPQKTIRTHAVRLREFGSRLSILFAIGIGILANIANWVLIFFTTKPDQEQIALHYNPVYGADLYGTWDMVYRIPLLGICILALHIFLGYVFFRKERLASYLLVWVSCCMQLFFVIATVAIIYINQLPIN